MKKRTTTKAGAVPVTMPYLRVQDELRRLIREGRWATGAPLPGRRELARTFGAAVNTLNRAILNLAAEGYLQTSNRRGTFVAEVLPRLGHVIHRRTTPATVGILTCPQRESDLWHWDPTVLRAMEATFSALSIRTRAFEIPSDSATGMDETLASACAAGVDALAVTYFDGPADWGDALLRVAQAGFPPLTVVTTSDLPTPISHTAMDEVAAGYAAADHLLQCGYPHVRFLLPFQPPTWLQERLAGVRQALALTGAPVGNLDVGPALLAPTWPDWQDLQQSSVAATIVSSLVKKLVRTAPVGTAGLIVPNDVVAVLVRRALADCELSVGRDFGLISFDDSAEAARQGLTSLRQPLAEMADSAARALAGALQGRPLPTKMRFQSRLILRGSTQRGPHVPASPAATPVSRGTVRLVEHKQEGR